MWALANSVIEVGRVWRHHQALRAKVCSGSPAGSPGQRQGQRGKQPKLNRRQEAHLVSFDVAVSLVLRVTTVPTFRGAAAISNGRASKVASAH